MKTTKTLRIITALMLVALTVFTLAACGDSSSGSGSASDSKVLYTVNGADIIKATVVMVGTTPNLQLVFSNSTDKDIEVDFSKLTVKLSDGTEIGNLGLMRTIEAGKTYSQNTVTIEQKYGVKLGDTVSICYGGDLIATVEVEEF